MPYHITQLYRHSVKSGRAESLQSAQLTAQGIEGDRRFMLVDQQGTFLSARRDPQLLSLSIRRHEDRLCIEHAEGKIELLVDPSPEGLSVTVWKRGIEAPRICAAADQFLTDWLGRPVYLVENSASAIDQSEDGKPWGPLFSDGYPLLVCSEASLATLNQACMADFEMLRFRPNIVLEGLDPWQEHRIDSIRIGSIELRAEKPCERCVLITRDPHTGERNPQQQPLRTLSQLNRRGQAVCFGENVSIVQPGTVQVGQEVEINWKD